MRSWVIIWTEGRRERNAFVNAVNEETAKDVFMEKHHPTPAHVVLQELHEGDIAYGLDETWH